MRSGGCIERQFSFRLTVSTSIIGLDFLVCDFDVVVTGTQAQEGRMGMTRASIP